MAAVRKKQRRARPLVSFTADPKTKPLLAKIAARLGTSEGRVLDALVAVAYAKTFGEDAG